MKMWHIMNIKVSNAGSNLNDRNRDVIRDPNDNRLVSARLRHPSRKWTTVLWAIEYEG